MLNYNSNIGDTTQVGLCPNGKSYYGAFDMAGNVWEWVYDWHDSSQQYRVLRGGSWLNVDSGVRSAVRSSSFYPDVRSYYFGFRCALSQ